MNEQLKDGAVNLLAGTCGAISCVYVGQPLDTIKVKMQAFPETYPNLWKCFRTTWRTDGVGRGLYAGTVPALIANIAENSVLFTSYNACQKTISLLRYQHTNISQLDTVDNGIAGSGAAFFAAVVLTPTELIKCRLQSAREKIGSTAKLQITPYSATRDIIRNDGLRGLMRGFTPTVAREMPGYYFFFAVYEYSREQFRKYQNVKTKDDVTTFFTFVSGGFAGLAFWTAIFPTDVIKSRMQVKEGKGGNFLKVITDIYQKEGFLKFYNGLSPTLLRTFPATGALFLTVEFVKSLF
ncbi:hypothetical protein SNEBB_009803 [Seison nebaliae]|nr:hypothetical protein SNEBB_009803 [Seison nebaliae]